METAAIQIQSAEMCATAARPISEMLAVIGGKWTVLIIGMLRRKPQRFSELHRGIDGISRKMLTSTLRDLEKDGFLTRTVTPTIPPRVDYHLTQMGEELGVPLRALAQWALANQGRVDAARALYTRARSEAA